MIPEQGICHVALAVFDKREPRRIITFGTRAAGDPGGARDPDLLIAKRPRALPCRRTPEVRAPFREDCPCAVDLLVFILREAGCWKECEFPFARRMRQTRNVASG